MAFLTDQDRQQIADAIAAAERRTSGELVTVIAQAADDYRYIPLLWPALAALLLPALLLTVWPEIGAWRLYLVQAAGFVVLALIAHLPRVHLALVPASVKRRRASRLAREQFFEQGLHLTRARTGVLIFVAVAEHHVEIIADTGINALVPPGTWDRAVAEFVAAGPHRQDRRGVPRRHRPGRRAAGRAFSKAPRRHRRIAEPPDRDLSVSGPRARARRGALRSRRHRSGPLDRARRHRPRPPARA